MLSVLSPVLLIIAIAWLSYRRYYSRASVALGLLAATVIHYTLFNDAVSFSYYGTAALFNLLIMSCLWMMPVNPMRLDLVLIHFAAMIVQLVGFAMYEAGLSPMLYNLIMAALVVAEWIRLMLRTDHDRDYGYHKHRGRVSGFRSNAHSGH